MKSIIELCCSHSFEGLKENDLFLKGHCDQDASPSALIRSRLNTADLSVRICGSVNNKLFSPVSG